MIRNPGRFGNSPKQPRHAGKAAGYRKRYQTAGHPGNPYGNANRPPDAALQNPAVGHRDAAVGHGGEVFVVGHDHDGLPQPVAQLEKRRCISSRLCESRLPEGSSASSTAGELIRARAMATRCCSPPDSSSG